MQAAPLTIKDAAQVLGTSEQRVYCLIRENLIPPGVYVRIGRQIRIRPDRLEKWMDGGGAGFSGGWRRESADAA